MKLKKLLITTFVTLSIILLGSTTFASPGANILYQETDMGGGLWQYDYIFHNTSTAGEYLRRVYLDLDDVPIITPPVFTSPTGWFTSGGVSLIPLITADYVDAFTYDQSYDIQPGNSVNGFRLTIDYQVSNVLYTAYFTDHEIPETFYESSGTTAIVPEPISSILFLTGGTFLAGRRFTKRKKIA